MKEAMISVEIVHAVAPQVIVRAWRLQFAVRLLRDGIARRDAVGMVRRQYGCSQPTAWRIVDQAADMVLIQ